MSELERKALMPPAELKAGNRAYTAPFLFRQVEKLIYNLNWTDQSVWRDVVMGQPMAILARETIAEKISTMEWRIEPKDSSKRAESKKDIQYYTDLFIQNKEQNFDFINYVSWILEDALDLPFGSGVELVREGDDPEGRLLDYIPLDGATLLPTYNSDFPVVQRPPEAPITDLIVFPKHAINRLYYSPRRELKWRGWGMSPPQKIFMAINMISKGDEYYWKLLIDTPEVGILDLMDMEKESAEEWIESFRAHMTGVDPFKIPVLYEHNEKIEYISFTRNPAEIQFSNAITRYDAMIAGGYGLTLSSMGFQVASSGGETLAGSIRGERNDRTKGIGLAKRMVKMHFDRMIPEDLEFKWVDPDDEQQVARGRAQLSASTAYSNLIKNKVISPKEARGDWINSGLSSVSLPEDIPEEEIEDQLIEGGSQERQNMLTATQPPSAGGQGEVRQSMSEHMQEEILKALDNDSFPSFDHDLLIGDLTAIYRRRYEQELTTKSWWQKIGKSFPEYPIDAGAFFSGQITELALNFDSFKDLAKELTLDIENDSVDNSIEFRGNLTEIMIKSLADTVSEYINKKVKDI